MTLVPLAGLQVDAELAAFVGDEVLAGSSIRPEHFWKGFAGIVDALAPRNRELLAERARLQGEIDAWHRAHPGPVLDAAAYERHLREIGYLVADGPAFTIDTAGVDDEIAVIAGPQLVVPVSNARYALNAANARWGSLYDALYGTDALGTLPSGGPYDPVRGGDVVAWVRQFLDDVVPLHDGSHATVTAYRVDDGRLRAAQPGGVQTELADPNGFAGYTGDPVAPASVVLTHHGLGIELLIDRSTPVGAVDAAGVSDVMLEAAVTTIIDFEDSIAAVDAADKVAAYRNWLGLMTGDLTADITKDGATFVRRLHPDRSVTRPDGTEETMRTRALLLVRNVGLLMTTPAVLAGDGTEVPEGLLDAIVTVAIGQRDLAGDGRNSPAGSIYVVKPKLHGPAEVAFTVEVFERVEQVLGLPPNTVKIGIMDEERRTTVNLRECIRAARSRVAFINTGFLDRTGDEIHTSMAGGPVVRKADMRTTNWIRAYEDHNVDVGLACGLPGRAQIGKGMWAAPDLMADMLAQKVGHPDAGANCAWVPSPTAATLHATHYHRVDVGARQRALASSAPRATLADILTVPVVAPAWTAEDIQAELDNNAQGILGYVVRWIDQGIGCSKVPDIHDIALMEDRATCRISSQHIANWLRHGVVDAGQVEATFQRMAAVVDAQNAGDAAYVPMAPEFTGVAFRAALALVMEGGEQPSGYTEPILHRHRLEAKARRAN